MESHHTVSGCWVLDKAHPSGPNIEFFGLVVSQYGYFNANQSILWL